MALGDSPLLSVTSDLTQLWNSQSISVQVAPSQAGQQIPRDRFLRPITDLPTVTVSVVPGRVDEDIKQTAEGGQPIQKFEFMALPGTINENDVVTWSGHQYRVSSLWPSTFGGVVQVSYCKADRMVGT